MERGQFHELATDLFGFHALHKVLCGHALPERKRAQARVTHQKPLREHASRQSHISAHGSPACTQACWNMATVIATTHPFGPSSKKQHEDQHSRPSSYSDPRHPSRAHIVWVTPDGLIASGARHICSSVHTPPFELLKRAWQASLPGLLVPIAPHGLPSVTMQRPGPTIYLYPKGSQKTAHQKSMTILISYNFWQFLPEVWVSYWSGYNFSVVPALFTVYLLHELKVPDKRVRQNENNPY